MRPVHLLSALALVVAALAAAPPALAQGKKPPPAKVDPKLAEAKKLFDDGAAAYAQGSYEEAIKAWEKAFEISGKPLIHESIANAWERLGDAKKARDHLAKWREAAPPDERDLLDARLKNLDARVQREEEAARKAAEDAARREAEAKATADAAKQKPSWVPGAILAGGGGALLIAGLTLDGVAKGKRPASDACKASGGQTYCLGTASSAIKSSNTMAIAGDVLWITGAAAAATGGVLLVVLRPKTQRAPEATGWLSPMPGGVMVGGSF
jgi:tetratricopeptide (TPR) repeat protein